MGLLKKALLSGAIIAVAKDFNKNKRESPERDVSHNNCGCHGHGQAASGPQYHQQAHYQPQYQQAPPQSIAMPPQQQYQQPQYQQQYQQPPPAYQNQYVQDHNSYSK